MCSLIPIMKSPIKSNRRISLSRDAPFSWLCSVCSTSVSIHAPRAGCDKSDGAVLLGQPVSIHAPRAGCDISGAVRRKYYASFNPRTPGGVRQQMCKQTIRKAKFQSTHPGRGATFALSSDLPTSTMFQSTHPGRGATRSFSHDGGCRHVSIHAPRAGCDCIKRKGLKVRVICGTFCERIGVDFL